MKKQLMQAAGKVVESSQVARRMVEGSPIADFVFSKRATVELMRLIRWVSLIFALCVIMILAMWAIRLWDPLASTKAAEISSWEIFLAVFGLAYAIIIGLFIVEGYRRYNELSSTIQSECNVIGDIHDCLVYFNDNGENEMAIQQITESLLNYVQRMEREIEFMQKPRNKLLEIWMKQSQIDRKDFLFTSDWRKIPRVFKQSRYTDRGVSDLLKYVDTLKPTNESKRHALGTIINKICELTTHRVNRLELGERHLVFPLYLLIIFMSVIIVLGIMLLDVKDVWVHGYIIFATTVGLTALFLLLYDLDRPFVGYWSIESDMLKDIKEKLIHKF